MAEVQFIIFTVAGESYGVNVRQVKSIERLPQITRVPNTISFIKGIVNLRGGVVPVLDMRQRVGAGHMDDVKDDEQRMIVVSIGNYEVGLVVDSVQDVQTVSDKKVENPPELVGGLHARYLDGIVTTNDALLILLNLEQILTDAEQEQLKEVERSLHG